MVPVFLTSHVVVHILDYLCLGFSNKAVIKILTDSIYFFLIENQSVTKKDEVILSSLGTSQANSNENKKKHGKYIYILDFLHHL